MNDLQNPTIQALLLVTLLTLPIKAVALWRASHYEQKGWFGVLLVFNTAGMLDLAYLFYFTKPQNKTKHTD